MMNILHLFCPPAFAHPGEVAVSPSVSAAAWWEWRFEWVLLLILVFVGAVYFRWLKEAQQNTSSPFHWKYPLRFGLAMLCIYIAAASPIDSIGETYLFSMHMVQHNIFMYPVPWLILTAIPGWMAEYWLNKSGPAGQITYRVFKHPVTACLLFNLIFTLWHIPFLYDWALKDRMVHNLEHFTMITTSVILWLPTWNPIHKDRPVYPLQMLYLIALAIAQLPVFAYVTFSKNVLYPTYAYAPRLTSLSAHADQQLGGVIMKITAMVVLFIAFIGVCMAWYQTQVEADRIRDENALKAAKAAS